MGSRDGAEGEEDMTDNPQENRSRGRHPDTLYCAHCALKGQDHGDGPFCRLTGKERPVCPHCTTAGRPRLEIDGAVLERLRDAFSLDSTKAEAVAYAGISLPTLTLYCEEHPEFLEEIKNLRQRPTLKARETVVKDLAQDSGIAFRYLERKRPDEFAPSATMRHQGEVVHRLDPAGEEKILKLSQQLDAVLRAGYAEPQLPGAGAVVVDVDKPVDGTPRDQDGDGDQA